MFTMTVVITWIFLAMLTAMVTMATDSPFIVWGIVVVVAIVMSISGLSGVPVPSNEIIRGIMFGIPLYALSGWIVVGALAFLEDF